MKCRAKKADKSPCNAHAMKGTAYCFRHTKTLKKRAIEASSQGGRAKRHIQCYGPELQINGPDDIRDLLVKTVNCVWTGKMPSSNPAGAIGYLARVYMEVYNRAGTANDRELTEEVLYRIISD